MQNRIEELQRQQLVAQSALAQQTHLLGADTQDPQQSTQRNGRKRIARAEPQKTRSQPSARDAPMCPCLPRMWL